MKFLSKLVIPTKWKVILAAILTVLCLYFVGLTVYNSGHPITGWIRYTWSPAIWMTLNIFALLTVGNYLFKAYPKLIKGQLDMNTLIALSAHILFIFSVINTIIKYKNGYFGYEVFWEASTLLICFAYIGNVLETRLRNSNVQGYKELLKLKKKTAVILKKGIETEVPISQVKVGDHIVVKKGEIIPLDGKLFSKLGVIDNSNITGESKLFNATKGEQITSGSLNVDSKIIISVTHDYTSSTIYLIVDKAEDLSMIKPKMQKFADKILKVFLPGVMTLSILAFAVWMTLGYGYNIRLPWFPKASHLEISILAMVTVLAIACPCALGVATPLIITISSMEANKNHLLFANPEAFEKIKEVEIVAFDKTGTLTTGEMKVIKYTGSKKDLAIAAAIESHSNHPIAKAIYNKFKSSLKVKSAKEISGQGIESTIDGNKYVLMKSDVASTSGATTIKMMKNKEQVATFEVMDEIKPNAKKLINWLHKQKIKVAMITGDSDAAAQRVVSQLSIDSYFADVKPDEKQEIIKQLKNQTKKQVMFVGDGFNDILAIQESDVSMSFSTGSDITNSLADISILNNDLLSVAQAIKLSQMTKKTVVSTLAWAFVFNGFAIPVAFVLLIFPWVAALLMLASDLAVVLNAILFKYRAERKLKSISSLQ